MSVFGICMVRDAEDIIGYIVEHMIEEVDYLVIADNLSQDNTRKILDSFGTKITVVDDNDPAYRQSEKMTALAHLARKMDVISQNSDNTFVVPFDADEWWYSERGRLADVIRDNNYCVNVAPMYDHVPTAFDDKDPNPMRRIAWRRNYHNPLHKVACRVTDDLTIEMGNHNATYKTHMPTYSNGLINIRHYPYRTPEQFVDKAVVGAMALELTDLPYQMGQHWRDYAKIAEAQGPEALHDVFRQWFWSSDPGQEGLVFDPIVP